VHLDHYTIFVLNAEAEIPDPEACWLLLPSLSVLRAGRRLFAVLLCKLVQAFSTKDIDGQRSLVRGMFQANTGMTVVQYYVGGPTYVVPLLVAGNRDGAATIVQMDPILSSPRWLGKPLDGGRRPLAQSPADSKSLLRGRDGDNCRGRSPRSLLCRDATGKPGLFGIAAVGGGDGLEKLRTDVHIGILFIDIVIKRRQSGSLDFQSLTLILPHESRSLSVRRLLVPVRRNTGCECEADHWSVTEDFDGPGNILVR
jgi:hypothetical protein